MEYTHRELGLLIGLLQAEADGLPADREEYRRLARHLAALYPVITGSMEQILNRADAACGDDRHRAEVSRHEWA